MTPPPRITVLGSLHMDIVVHAGRQPRLGETLPGNAWRPTPGGKGLNQAVHAALHANSITRAGAQVRMVGRIGKDDFAPPLLAWLHDQGVDTSEVRCTEQAGTGMSVAIVEKAGDYAAVIVSGANQYLDETDLTTIVKDPPDWLVLQYEIAPDVLAPAASAVRAGGGRVLLNAAPACPAPPGLLASVDLLVVNAIEAEMLTGIKIANSQDALDALADLRARVPAMVLTLGPDGLLLAEGVTPPQRIAGHEITVQDTHGAGDALIGALVSRLALGDTLVQAARYANAAAALMVASDGANPQAAAPDRVWDFLSRASASGA